MPKLEFLDHVAIHVKDPEVSAQWYEKVLGLSRVQPEEWSPVPIMMLATKSGIALFSNGGEEMSEEARQMFHIAFRVEDERMDEMKESLRQHNVAFTEKNHKYFLSIYFDDPDGYHLEVTMRILDF